MRHNSMSDFVAALPKPPDDWPNNYAIVVQCGQYHIARLVPLSEDFCPMGYLVFDASGEHVLRAQSPAVREALERWER